MMWCFKIFLRYLIICSLKMSCRSFGMMNFLSQSLLLCFKIRLWLLWSMIVRYLHLLGPFHSRFNNEARVVPSYTSLFTACKAYMNISNYFCNSHLFHFRLLTHLSHLDCATWLKNPVRHHLMEHNDRHLVPDTKHYWNSQFLLLCFHSYSVSTFQKILFYSPLFSKTQFLPVAAEKSWRRG